MNKQQYLKLYFDVKNPPKIGPIKSPIETYKLFIAEAISFAVFYTILFTLTSLVKANKPSTYIGEPPKPKKISPNITDIIYFGNGGTG